MYEGVRIGPGRMDRTEFVLPSFTNSFQDACIRSDRILEITESARSKTMDKSELDKDNISAV
jgi:hypothetical protein